MRRGQTRRLLTVAVVSGFMLAALPDSAVAVDAPAATLTATAVADPASDSVLVGGALTVDPDSTPAGDETVELWVKRDSATTYTEYDAATTDDTGRVLFTVDGSALPALFATGPFDFQLRHPASATADITASDPLLVTPRATDLVVAPSLKAITFGQPSSLIIKGSLTFQAGGAGVPTAAPIDLEAMPAGSSTWTLADTSFANASGQVSFTAAPTVNTAYRLVYVSQSPGSASAVSAASTVLVRQQVSFGLSPTIVPPGGSSTISVTVRPTIASGDVRLQRLSGSHWKTLEVGKLTSASAKTWRLKVNGRIAKTKYRVSRPASLLNATGTSAAHTFTVEKHGGGKPRAHTFLFHYQGHPLRWNPCRRIHYRVNLREAPTGALAEVKETLRRISLASGLHFSYDGTTDMIPADDRRQPAELVVAWSRPAQTDLPLGGGILGEGGGNWEAGAGFPAQIIDGYAVLLAGQHLTQGFGAGETEGELLMHELGHAMGLNHTQSRSQIMFPELFPHSATMYGAGDYRGLQLLGRSQGCLS